MVLECARTPGSSAHTSISACLASVEPAPVPALRSAAVPKEAALPCAHAHLCLLMESLAEARLIVQELLAAQLIHAFAHIFQESSLPLYVRPYEVLVTSSRTALIEVVPDSLSIHTIKVLLLHKLLIDLCSREGLA